MPDFSPRMVTREEILAVCSKNQLLYPAACRVMIRQGVWKLADGLTEADIWQQ